MTGRQYSKQHIGTAAIQALEPRLLLAAQLVRDIDTTVVASHPQDLVDVNGRLFFTANGGVHGRQLWTSDGTELGTVLVKEIVPGNEDYDRHRHLTNVNGTLFFTIDDGVHGRELWRSDGTRRGTVMVRDIRPGASTDGYVFSSDPQDLAAIGGILYFTADNGLHGRELWRSDGTKKGTVLVKDIQPGTGEYGGLTSHPAELTNVNGTLFFTAVDRRGDHGLWRSDGTKSGTVLVKTIGPIAWPQSLTVVETTLYFIAEDEISGRELWKSDGTQAGTVLVKDIQPGTDEFGDLGSNPAELTNVDGTLFFTANDGVHGYELWKSDGTEAGTELVRDIPPSSDSASPRYLTNVNGTLYFTATDSTGEGLWKTDGTESGTVQVKAINAFGLAADDGVLYFLRSEDGTELWRSDGTETGTVMIKNGLGGSVGPLTNVGGVLLFAASVAGDQELWKSDGTEAGTVLLKDVRPGTAGSYSFEIISAGGNIFFGSQGSADTSGLWTTDGSAPGTTKLMSGWAQDLTDVDGTLFSLADALWTSDGTTSGTVVVKSSSNDYAFGFPRDLVELDGRLYLVAGDYYDGDGVELWTSDRTEHGTVQVKDIYPGTHTESDQDGFSYQVPNSAEPSELYALDGTLYFTAMDSTYNRELWKSDGTGAGTIMVKDICTDISGDYGPLGSDPENLIGAGGILFFTADDGIGGRELWKTDGTETGTVMVRDINPGAGGSDPSDLTSVNGILYFAADNGRHGRELWRSDGSAKGTWRIGDIFSGRAGSAPSSLRAVNDVLFFAADDGIHGSELWRSDGTLEGTSLVADINPGSNGSSPSKLTDVAGALYFTANDRSHGTELWKTDGTLLGTLRMSDIVPGRGGSDPDHLTDINGRLFFSADDHFHGRELWHLPFASLSNGILTIDGTEQDDIITVKPSGVAGLRVSVNGVIQKFSATATKSIRINSLGGDDLIDFSRIATPTRVTASVGNDSIISGAARDTLDGGQGIDTVRASDGLDVLLDVENDLR